MAKITKSREERKQEHQTKLAGLKTKLAEHKIKRTTKRSDRQAKVKTHTTRNGNGALNPPVNGIVECLIIDNTVTQCDLDRYVCKHGPCIKIIDNFDIKDVKNKSLNIPVFCNIEKVGAFSIKGCENSCIRVDQSFPNVTGEVEIDIGDDTEKNKRSKIEILNAFPNVTVIGEFEIKFNLDSHIKVSGFNKAIFLEFDLVKNSRSCVNIDGFNGVVSMNEFGIETEENGKESLDICGFNCVESLGELDIWINNSDLHLDGFNNVMNVLDSMIITILNNSKVDINAFNSAPGTIGGISLGFGNSHGCLNVLNNIKCIEEILLVFEKSCIDMNIADKCHGIIELGIDIVNHSNVKISGFNGSCGTLLETEIGIDDSCVELCLLDKFVINEFTLNVGNSRVQVDIANSAKTTGIEGDICIEYEPLKGSCLKAFNNIIQTTDIELSLDTVCGVELFECLQIVIDDLEIDGKAMPSFNSLKQASCIKIEENSAIEKICGFKCLEHVGEIVIEENSELIAIDAFDCLRTAECIDIDNNGNLKVIEAFGKLLKVGEITIVVKKHFCGLDCLLKSEDFSVTIDGHEPFTSIESLRNFQKLQCAKDHFVSQFICKFLKH
jgi:hypothetical protein